MIRGAALVLVLFLAAPAIGHGPGRPDLFSQAQGIYDPAVQPSPHGKNRPPTKCNVDELIAASVEWAVLTAPVDLAAVSRWIAPKLTQPAQVRLREQAAALLQQADALDYQAKAEARWRQAVAVCR